MLRELSGQSGPTRACEVRRFNKTGPCFTRNKHETVSPRILQEDFPPPSSSTSLLGQQGRRWRNLKFTRRRPLRGPPRRAAWTQQPPADLESAAPLPPFDNVINRSIREQVRRHPASTEEGERGRDKEREGKITR